MAIGPTQPKSTMLPPVTTDAGRTQILGSDHLEKKNAEGIVKEFRTGVKNDNWTPMSTIPRGTNRAGPDAIDALASKLAELVPAPLAIITKYDPPQITVLAREKGYKGDAGTHSERILRSSNLAADMVVLEHKPVVRPANHNLNGEPVSSFDD